MQYDPIKRALGNVFNKSTGLRILFYKLLDLLLLRCWHIHRELKLWKKNNASAKHIFDAGAGFGQYSYYMHRMNGDYKIVAADVKDEQVADCNNFFKKLGTNNVTFVVADLTQYKQPETFDLVLCVDVMEHIEDDNACFRNYCTSLKKGGLLLISTPSDQGGSDVHEGEDASFIEEHVRDGYNMQDIIDKITKAGFSRVEALYSYGTPGKLSWRLSMKWPIQLLGVSKLFFVIIPFYYLFVYPFCYILNWWDTNKKHTTGTGLIVKAWK